MDPEELFAVLNSIHPSIQFTMQKSKQELPFLSFYLCIAILTEGPVYPSLDPGTRWYGLRYLSLYHYSCYIYSKPMYMYTDFTSTDSNNMKLGTKVILKYGKYYC